MNKFKSFNTEDTPQIVSPVKSCLFYIEGEDGNFLYDYYLTGVIESDTSDYVEMMQCLRSLTPQDVFTIHINCPGGSVHTGEQILSAMKDSKGYIIASVEGQACSMATQICLHADEVVVSDGSIFMVHNLSSGAYGNIVNMEDSTAYLRSLNKYLAKLYETLLTEEEFVRVESGRDVTLFAEDMRERLKSFEYPRWKVRQEEPVEAEEGFDLEKMIEDAVARSVEKAIRSVLSKSDLTPKTVKPKKTTKAPDVG